MINYLRVSCDVKQLPEYASDLLVYEMGELGFESFETENNEFFAYIKESIFDKGKLQQLIDETKEIYQVYITYSLETIEQKNWNEEWEKNYFQPIVVGNKCLIRSSFHTNLPATQYDIIIDPKMAFGTGHHETTSLMLEWILEEKIENKSFLDMGCGTAVLAILASMRGANPVWAVDIDEWSYKNAVENSALNNVSLTKIALGGSEVINGQMFDYIIANINLNVLIENMHTYVMSLNKGGILIMSGFYFEDIAKIEAKATLLGLQQVDYKQKNNWVSVKFRF